MYGFQHKITEEWLDNDFQSPHFPTIDALIEKSYPSLDAFEAVHGSPAEWEKREISDEDIQQIFSGGGE